ncbi:E3 ubiquitin/ISG15 ligase TRIM25-like [Dicentrarchus labrax]|uniref:E3 ubiquitin/ISG15 ligase TRIM25-like n=1 Tax=Dicentrarchus labrax TaxID=13489 RepID=UPI0021F64447|nr:E3 ubiquitin/ISG15 ligase TRIM25-like [Dicentrarchus labrax]XP_051243794.1 E3 ubiquitin/ISG15 ligase TRIM25-like [Dicentrarchus labrax]
MAAASSFLSEDQFLCSICLDVFTDPVTTSCGHNFCKNCISEHWNINVPCKCPVCKKVFNTRPELLVNTFVSEMVDYFRQSAQQRASSSSEQQAAKPGEIPCDVCTGTKLKALKSCLVCLVSYCETHLEPHLTATGLKRHQLIDPVRHLEGRLCTKHDKQLELFMLKKHRVRPLSHEGYVRPAVGELLGTLQYDMEKLFPKAEPKTVQQSAVDVALDPDTANPIHLFPKSQPEKVGVFVDSDKGLVSFYDVDAARFIFSFTGCSFTEKLFPFFSPSLNHGGKNSAPLIICPVNPN